jgi:AcrR family transcriptional regulator
VKVAQQQRSAEKVAALLATARRLLQDHPQEAVTTRRIASEAGVSVAALYRHFVDVEDLLDVLVHEHAERATAVVEQALRSCTSTDPADVYVAVLDAHLHLYREHPELTVAWRSPQLAARQQAVEEASDRALARRVGDHLVAIGAIEVVDELAALRLEAHWSAAGAALGVLLQVDDEVQPALQRDVTSLVHHLGTSWRTHPTA